MTRPSLQKALSGDEYDIILTIDAIKNNNLNEKDASILASGEQHNLCLSCFNPIDKENEFFRYLQIYYQYHCKIIDQKKAEEGLKPLAEHNNSFAMVTLYQLNKQDYHQYKNKAVKLRNSLALFEELQGKKTPEEILDLAYLIYNRLPSAYQKTMVIPPKNN